MTDTLLLEGISLRNAPAALSMPETWAALRVAALGLAVLRVAALKSASPALPVHAPPSIRSARRIDRGGADAAERGGFGPGHDV